MKKKIWKKLKFLSVFEGGSYLKSRLDDVLITEGLKCNDLNSTNPLYYVDMENFLSTADRFNWSFCNKNNIQMAGPCKIGKNNIVPGWNDQVRPFGKDAAFWNAF